MQSTVHFRFWGVGRVVGEKGGEEGVRRVCVTVCEKRKLLACETPQQQERERERERQTDRLGERETD